MKTFLELCRVLIVIIAKACQYTRRQGFIECLGVGLLRCTRAAQIHAECTPMVRKAELTTEPRRTLSQIIRAILICSILEVEEIEFFYLFNFIFSSIMPSGSVLLIISTTDSPPFACQLVQAKALSRRIGVHSGPHKLRGSSCLHAGA